MEENKSKLECLEMEIEDLYEILHLLKYEELKNYKIYKINQSELIKHNCRIDTIIMIGMGLIVSEYISMTGDIDLGIIAFLGVFGCVKLNNIIFKKFHDVNNEIFKINSEETSKSLNNTKFSINNCEKYQEIRSYLSHIYNDDLIDYDTKRLIEVINECDIDELNNSFSSKEIKLLEDEIYKYLSKNNEKGYQKTYK